jgi:hypothetical protein
MHGGYPRGHDRCVPVPVPVLVLVVPVLVVPMLIVVVPVLMLVVVGVVVAVVVVAVAITVVVVVVAVIYHPEGQPASSKAQQSALVPCQIMQRPMCVLRLRACSSSQEGGRGATTGARNSASPFATTVETSSRASNAPAALQRILQARAR